jgi:hypothetical protein
MLEILIKGCPRSRIKNLKTNFIKLLFIFNFVDFGFKDENAFINNEAEELEPGLKLLVAHFLCIWYPKGLDNFW